MKSTDAPTPWGMPQSFMRLGCQTQRRGSTHHPVTIQYAPRTPMIALPPVGRFIVIMSQGAYNSVVWTGAMPLDSIDRWCLPGEPWCERRDRVDWTPDAVPVAGAAPIVMWTATSVRVEFVFDTPDEIVAAWNRDGFGHEPVLAWMYLPTPAGED